MTHRERMLAAVRGEPTDRLPWVPRLDLWYKANQRAGTLPARYRGATLREVAEGLNAGFHAVVPDFRDLRGPEDDVDRALGIYNLRSFPYATALRHVERVVRWEGDQTTVEYRTPVGDLRTRVLYDEGMRKAGITITHIAEHAVKSHRDLEAVGYLFEHAEVSPNPEGYAQFAESVGDHGLAVAFVSLAGSPMHLLQRELMAVDAFFYEYYDHPSELFRCAERIGTYLERVFEALAQCPAEVVFVGANYDATVTYPPFFREHISPWLGRAARACHSRGKLLLTHTDGENTGLLDAYLDSGIDIADSVCPKPMTKLSLKQVRDHFDGRITIWGGIPSVVLLRDTISDRDFDAFLDGFFEEVGRGDHLILGISDTTPPAAAFERLERIARRVEAFGPVG